MKRMKRMKVWRMEWKQSRQNQREDGQNGGAVRQCRMGPRLGQAAVVFVRLLVFCSLN